MNIGLIIAIFILVIIVAIVGYVYYVVKTKKRTSKFLVPTLVSIAIVFGITFAIVPFSFHTVNAGEVAVVKHLGKAKKN